ncbi:MAG: hypothetical protein U0183_33850 [Polyangiaceae bacterium]
MSQDSLQRFIEAVRTTWGPLTSELVSRTRHHVAKLLEAPLTEAWLTALHEEFPEARELHRDAAHGFLLMAHTEQIGLYRPPHDHGRGWVVYAVQRGEMEMSTYRRVHDLRGGVRLVRRESFVLRPGDVRVFLPGDIHDTRCTTGPLTLLRFTSRDLKREDVVRYPEPTAVVCAASSREAP